MIVELPNKDRELDAYIAVNLFGWRWMHAPQDDKIAIWPVSLLNNDSVLNDVTDRFKEYHKFSDWDIQLPRYSTDAKDDYSVLNFMRDLSDDFSLRFRDTLLHGIYRRRAKSPEDYRSFLHYQPGDYSVAAFLNYEIFGDWKEKLKSKDAANVERSA